MCPPSEGRRYAPRKMTEDARQPRSPAGLGQRLVAALLMLCLVLAAVAQERTAEATFLVISKPPAPLLAGDPPRGLVFEVGGGLDRSAVVFDARRTEDARLPPGGPVALSYMAVDALGTAYFSFDDGPDPTAPGGVLIVPGWSAAAEAVAASSTIGGPSSGLQQPKDVALITTPDDGLWIAVADFGVGAVLVFDARLPGDQPPLFVLRPPARGDGLPAEARGSVWGVLYDEAAQRLWVSTTDGDLLVYDALPERREDFGPDRVIVPTMDGVKVSANLHGMSYHPATDSLIVSDVGAATTPEHGPAFASDGAILVIPGASLADGPTPVQARIAGSRTWLGNPIDVELAEDGSAYVSEAANHMVLRFTDVLGMSGAQDVDPAGALSLVSPESLLRSP